MNYTPIPLLLESLKNNNFQQPDNEVDFFIDSGAEPNNIHIFKWNQNRILHPKLPILKTSIKLSKAQGTNSTNYCKIKLSLIPTQIKEQNKF